MVQTRLSLILRVDIFYHAQAYGALNRVRTLKGVMLISLEDVMLILLQGVMLISLEGVMLICLKRFLASCVLYERVDRGCI